MKIAKFETRFWLKLAKLFVGLVKERFFTFRFFLLLALIFWSLSISVVKNLQIRNLWQGDGGLAVIEIGSPTPTPKVMRDDSEKRIIAKAGGGVSKKSSSHPLCQGITEPWKLVADPEYLGQYVICNTVSEAMTSVEELNRAQNQYRRDHGINTLSINNDLCEVAIQRAREIAANFSHDGFEAAIEGNNIDKRTVGENIASGPLSGAHFVEWSWDKSPGHRENMLRDWSDGCGGVYDRFAVFIFAK